MELINSHKVKQFLMVGVFVTPEEYLRRKGTTFFTQGIHALKDYPDLDFFGKLKIGNYVAIGGDSKILADVTICDNMMIGAGTVVSKSIPEGYIVAGNPMHHVGYVDKWYEDIKKNYTTAPDSGISNARKSICYRCPITSS